MRIVEWSQNPVAQAKGKYALGLISQEALQEFLSVAQSVDCESWHRTYSHVAFGDINGTLRLEDGREGRWLLRPGGLCRLDWENGEVSYLVRTARSTVGF